MAVDMSSMLTQSVTNGKIQDTSASAASLSKDKTAKTGDQMDKMDFINLLVAEMQYQDPLEPSTNTDYVAQMAQFSQVEALDSMKSAMQDMEASGLVGKTVVLSVTSETTGYTSEIEGKVDFVQYENGKTYLSVNGALYSMDDLQTVLDSDFYEANEISTQFTKMIAELPDAENVTLSDYDAIAKAMAVRDSLSSYQLGFIDAKDLSKLSSVITEIERMIDEEAARQQKEADDLAAQATQALSDALGGTGASDTTSAQETESTAAAADATTV